MVSYKTRKIYPLVRLRLLLILFSGTISILPPPIVQSETVVFHNETYLDKTNDFLCFDKHEFCSFWAEKHLCHATCQLLTMRDGCMASCGYCEPDESSLNKYFCRAEPKGYMSSSAADVSCFCEGWKLDGRCQEGQYDEFMQNYCVNSCGWVGKVSKQPNATVQFALEFVKAGKMIPDPPCLNEKGMFVPADELGGLSQFAKAVDAYESAAQSINESIFNSSDGLAQALEALDLTPYLKDELENPIGHPSGDRNDVQAILEQLIPVLSSSVTQEEIKTDDEFITITDEDLQEAVEQMGPNVKKTPPQSDRCPLGWTEGDATCYHTLELVGDFYQAAISCGAIGGSLAVVDNYLEWDFISTQLDAAQGYWLGATDKGHSGTWLNIDSTIFRSEWPSGQAPNSDTENCLSIISSGNGSMTSVNGSMTSVNGSEEFEVSAVDCYANGFGAVCERRFLDDVQACPYGWGHYAGMCFHIEAYRGDFKASREYCQLMNASDLGSPNDEGVLEFILSMGAGEGYFLGMTDKEDEGTWLTLDGGLYTGPFGPGEPSSKSVHHDCGAIVSVPKLVVGDAICDKTGSGVVCVVNQYNDLSPLTLPPTTDEPTTTAVVVEEEEEVVIEENVTTTTEEPTFEVKTIEPEEENFTTTTTEPPLLDHCPVGWTYWDFFCYKFVDYVADFYAALRYCNDLGGNLAQPKSIEEIDFMSMLAQPGFWLGVSDRGHEGYWRTLEGTLFSGQWGRGQPNNANGTEDCMRLMQYPGESSLTLDDFNCDLEGTGFVCKQLSNLLDNDITCGPDWIYYEGDCYYINVNNYTYQEAVESCEFIQSHLASPNDTEDLQQFVNWGASDGFWIGIQFSPEHNWTTSINETYTGPNLYDLEKSDLHFEEGKECGAFVWQKDHYVVGDQNCSVNGTGGLCKQDKRPTDVYCQPGWYLYEGMCYKMVDFQGTRGQLSYHCRQTGGRLATPTNYGVFAVMLALGAGKGCWLGPELDPENQVWRDDEGYRYIGVWGHDKPDANVTENEGCMLISEEQGVLMVDDMHCSYQGTGAVCEIGADQLLLGYTPKDTPEPMNTNASDPFCFPEWTHYQGACYRAVEYKGDFYSALSACGDLGGNLAILTNIAEKEFVIEDLNATEGYWLGATDEGHEKNWTTVDEGAYTGPWGPDQPDNGGEDGSQQGGQNCMIIGSFEGMLNVDDDYCTLEGKGYVCQQTLVKFRDQENETMSKEESQMGGECEDAWVEDSGVCYKAFPGSYTWIEAREYCEGKAAKLATPGSDLDTALFGDLVDGTNAWLGSLDNAAEGSWISLEASEYTGNWSKNGPGDEGDCMALQKGELVDANCLSKLNNLICYKSPGQGSINDEEIVCQKGQRYYQGFCYKIVVGSSNFEESKKVCRAECRGVVGYPSDDSDLGFFTSLGLPVNTWLGASDEVTEAAWLTSDNTFYNGPFYGEVPGVDTSKNCLRSEKLNGSLSVSDASCESDADAVLCRCDTSDSPSCPSGYKLYQGMCYIARVGNWSWSEARIMCEKDRGTLATPDSTQSISFFARIGAIDGSWLGANDIFDEGQFSSTSGVVYEGPLVEEASTPIDDCLVLRTASGKFQVSSTACHSLLSGAVCQKQPDIAEDFSESLCLEGYFFYAGKCWKVVLGTEAFDSAAEACKGSDSTLGYPSTSEDLKRLASFGVSHGIWAGVSDVNEEGTFETSDGPYSGPLDGQNGESKDCLRFKDQDGTLKIAPSDCTSGGYGALCVRNPIEHPLCPSGWLWRDGGCLKLIRGQMSAAQAEENCQLDFAHVVVPESDADLRFYQKVGAGNLFWLGGNNLGSDGVWRSNTGAEFNGLLWASGQPAGDTANCQMFLADKTDPKVTAEDCTVTTGAGTICHRRAAPSIASCPPGWFLFQSRCFALKEGKSNFIASEKLCQSLNASLAVPNSNEVLEFIISTGAGKGIWMGLESNNGYWVTVDNSSTSLADSVSALPADEGLCIQLDVIDNVITPSSLDCTSENSRGAVCELEAVDVEAQAFCEPGFTFYDGYCYKAFERKMDFRTAFAFCHQMEASLAYPKSVADFNFLLQIGADHGFWLGVTDLAVEGNFKTLDGETYPGPWGEGQPNGFGDPGEDCVDIWTVDNGSPFVNDNPCMLENEGAVCRKAPFQLIGYETLCPQGWVFFQDSCFKFQNRKLTYDKAEEFCAFENSVVAYPNGDNDFAFLLSMGAITGTWVGLNDRHVDGVWVTTDETSYEGAWFVNEPKLNDKMDCAMVQEVGGSKYVVATSCATTGSNFFCKRLIAEYPHCPEGWPYDNGQCYSVIPGNFTWQQAKDECEQFGAGMAAPRSKRELHYIVSLGASEEFWLGSRDLDQEGTWINVDGSAYEGPWAFNSPNDKGGEDCMNLLSQNNTLAPDDARCDQIGRGVVCNRKERGHPRCSTGWYLYGGKCFTRVMGNFNYSQAVETCKSFKMYSVISAPEHYGELDFMLGMGAGDGTWIGATDNRTEGIFVTERGLRYGRRETDGSHVDVFSFNEPDGGTAENCLILGKKEGSLGVFDRRCDHYGTGVMCEYIPEWSKKVIAEATTTAAPEVTMEVNPCGEWDNHGESCYKLVVKDDLSFNDALLECANQDAYLAQIDTRGELEYISTYSSVRDKFYVGAGDQKEDGVFLNIDGSLFNKDLWPKNQDSDMVTWEGDEDCVMTSFIGEEVFNLVPKSCSGPAFGVLCERPLNGVRICPPFYVLFFGYCYKYYPRSSTWLDAHHSCTLEAEARVAVPTSDVELELITYLSGGSDYTLLGSNDKEQEGLWVNDDSGAFNDQFWCENQPDGGTGQNCLALMGPSNGSEAGCADDISCDYNHNTGYVCEVNAAQYLESCPRGWVEHGSSCYNVFKGSFNWYKGVAVCSFYDSHAATLKSKEDLSFFTTDLLMKEDGVSTSWLGVSDALEEGDFRNIDLSGFASDVWSGGMPKSLNEGDDCVMWAESDLKDTSCHDVAESVVCEKPTMRLNACPLNYARFFERCFKKETISATYDDARHNCQGQGTIIGTPHNSVEMEFLKFYVESADEFALGAKCNSVSNAWIAGDGTKYSQIWLPGEPDGCDGKCLKLGHSELDGEVLYGPKDSDCDEPGSGFLCEIRAEDMKRTCPQGWEEREESCYLLMDNLMSWYEGVKVCGEFAATPVIVNDNEELEFIKSNQNFAGFERLWTGCTDFVEGEYLCIDETEFDLSLFPTNAKNLVHNASNDCLLINQKDSQFTILDWNCLDNAFGVICEKPIEVIEPPCPANYTRFFGDCFNVYYENLGYKHSITRCEDDESFLASPTNEFQLHFVAALAATSNILLGSTNVDNVNKWIGDDGSEFPSNLWVPGHPQNEDVFNCMGLDVTESKSHFGVITRKCTDPSEGFVCRQETFREPNVCPRGWHPGEESCYRTIPAAVDFFGAVIMCSYYTSMPALINSAAERELLSTFGVDGYWLGASDIVNEGRFENLDGTDLQRSRFQDGEPDNFDGIEDCAILQREGDEESSFLHVGDTNCDTVKNGVVCEREKDMTGNSCPGGFVRWRDRCYKKVFAPVTWHQARSACRAIGALLSVPDNQQEMTWIKALGQKSDQLWLGSSDLGHRGVWINEDGSSYYENWLDGQPDNDGGNEQCMQLRMVNFEYGPADEECDGVAQGYICELNLDPEDICPYGWARNGDSCYFNKDDLKKWTASVVQCSYHNGAHPTYVDNLDELVFVGKHGTYSKWLGDSNAPNSHNKTLFSWRRSNGDDESLQLPLADPKAYDGDFECSLLSVTEEGDDLKNTSSQMNWIVNDPEVNEGPQADHVNGPVALELQKRKRRDLGLLEAFSRSVIDVEESGETKSFLIEMKAESCDTQQVYQCELKPQIGNKECPLGWLHFQNRCYKYFEEESIWSEARKRCKEEGAQLVVIDSRQEQEVCQLLSMNSDNTWVGSTDENHEGLWINVDGSDFVMRWAVSTEPDNGQISQGEQNCMVFRNVEVPSNEEGGSEEDFWSFGPSDIACDAVSSPGFICEQPDNSTNSLQLCPLGWYKYGDQCYRLFDFEMTFVEAAQYCGFYDSFLASIHENTTEFVLSNKFVKNEDRTWVGVHDFGIAGDFVNMDNTPFAGSWARPDDVFLCNNETVSGLIPLAHCGTLHKNGLEFTNCTNKVDSFICQRPVKGPKCDHQFVLFGGRCYYREFTFKAPLDWAKASLRCNAKTDDSDLVSINSESERDFVRLFGAKTQYMALGSQDEGHEGVWLNRDGTVFNNKLWQAGQPTDCCGGQHCMGLWYDEKDLETEFNYVIDDLPCDGNFNGYICEAPRTEGDAVGCQRGWVEFKDGCYQVTTDSEATFLNGVEQCSYDDASLASLSDSDSLQFLTTLLADFEGSYYVGLNAWGENDTYVNTRANEIFTGEVGGNGEGLERCVKTSSSGELLPTLCDSVLDGYVCEVKLNENLKCDASKITYQDQCYKYFEDNLSWNNAKTRCEFNGGFLMTINAREELWLAKQLVPNSRGSVHVGVVYSPELDNYSNMDSTLFKYEFWSPESLEYSGKDKLCGGFVNNPESEMGPSLEKIDCNYEIAMGYICEFDS